MCKPHVCVHTPLHKSYAQLTRSHVCTQPSHTGTATLTSVGHTVAWSLAPVPPPVCNRLSLFLGFSTFGTFAKNHSGIWWKYLMFPYVLIGIWIWGEHPRGEVPFSSHCVGTRDAITTFHSRADLRRVLPRSEATFLSTFRHSKQVTRCSPHTSGQW